MELLIVIVVIGVLASISIVAFTGVQKHARAISYNSSLSQIAKLMEIAHTEDGHYPHTLSQDIVRAGSPNSVQLVGGVPTYENLTPVQRGVLFQDVCATLVTEGYGSGINQAGQHEQYISGCHVYGDGAMQINGWHSRSFSTPISADQIYDWYADNVGEDSWRPEKKQLHLDFATELTNRYISSGGTFPVTSFWDPWAGGTPAEELPEPAIPDSLTTYCIELANPRHTQEIWHIRQGGTATEGACR